MKYGKNAKVGNITVFSRQGAIEAYKTFCKAFNKYGTLEASAVLSGAMLDMFTLGFTADECEAIELAV